MPRADQYLFLLHVLLFSPSKGEVKAERNVRKTVTVRSGGIQLYSSTLTVDRVRHIKNNLVLRDALGTRLSFMKTVFLLLRTGKRPSESPPLASPIGARQTIVKGQRRTHGVVDSILKCMSSTGKVKASHRTWLWCGRPLGRWRWPSTPGQRETFRRGVYYPPRVYTLPTSLRRKTGERFAVTS